MLIARLLSSLQHMYGAFHNWLMVLQNNREHFCKGVNALFLYNCRYNGSSCIDIFGVKLTFLVFCGSFLCLFVVLVHTMLFSLSGFIPGIAQSAYMWERHCKCFVPLQLQDAAAMSGALQKKNSERQSQEVWSLLTVHDILFECRQLHLTWKRLMSRGFPAFFRQFWLHFRKNLRKNLYMQIKRGREKQMG